MMKVKSLLVIMVVSCALLLYCMFCYKLVNKTYDSNTRYIIKYYLETNFRNIDSNYKYLKTVNNEDNSLSIFIKTKENNTYYRFILSKEGNSYRILDVNQNIPSYIKKIS